jgi:hypothetical protein
MIAATWGVVAIVAQAMLGWGGGHDPVPDSSEARVVENAAILAQVARLQTSPRRRDRDHAAHALRKVDWRCHPEVVGALAYSLLHDPEEEVREEAAQSLTRMAPCLAVAHEALSRAADADPDHSTRHWARKGLKALGRRCEGLCKVCGQTVVGPGAPIPGGPAIPVPASLPAPVEAVIPPIIDPADVPPSDPPAPPPDRPPPFSKGPELFAPDPSS